MPVDMDRTRKSYFRNGVLLEITLLSILFLSVSMAAHASPQEGETLFTQMCASCHTVGQGTRVGPDLKGVSTRRNKDWLKKWISEPDKMLAAKDPIATELLAKSNNVPMPNQGLTEPQVTSLIEFFESQDAAKASPETTPVATTPVEPSKEDIARGQDLFQGHIRFANKGPACNACHHVKNDAVIGGGILAKELTAVFSRMGGEGVTAILGSPPFPVMQVAYKDKTLTKEEISSLVAFLQYADKQQSFQQPRDYGFGLFTSGVLGSGVLIGFYALFGRNRKRSVNQAIYDRQVKSEDE